MSRKDLVQIYFKENNLVKHQIDTYNRFILFDIENIIYNEPTLKTIKNDTVTTLQLFGVFVDFPNAIDENHSKKPLFPLECRQKDITYESNLYVQIRETIVTNNALIKDVTHNRILLAKIPTMVKSCICNVTKHGREELLDDSGGYFVVHGKERVIVGQMRNSYNRPICGWKNDELICEVRSMSEETSHSNLITVKITKTFDILMTIPYVKDPISIGYILKTMNIYNMEQYEFYIGKEHYLKRYLTQLLIDSRVEADVVIISKNEITLETILNFELFPHLGISNTFEERIQFLSYILRLLFMTHKGLLLPEEKDSLSNKRVEFCGQLCADLFKMLYKKFLKNTQLLMEKQHRLDLTSLNKTAGITSGLLYSFATGNWGVQKNNYIRTGVCQIPHPKVSNTGFMSCMRRIIVPSGKEGKNDKIRQLHPSTIFFICPHETPEGQSVGVVLNMALFCQVSRKISTIVIKQILKFRLQEILKVKSKNQNVKIVINEIFFGECTDEKKLQQELRLLKRKNIINYDVTWHYNENLKLFEIFSDAGRLIRPLICIENFIKYKSTLNTLSWKDCLKYGIIEYLDARQLENCSVAMTEKNLLDYTTFQYLEMDVNAMMGIVASQIPFSNHTQSPRICYQSSMAKQAIGVLPQILERAETINYNLEYAQKPLCTTKMADLCGMNKYPNGINAIVAIACYTGYNQEDSVILNKSSVDRGLFNITSSRTVAVEENYGGSNDERICLPDFSIRKLHYNYSHLDENGIVKLKTFVKKNDIIVGKVITQKNKKKITTIDDSLSIKAGEEGQIVNIIKKTKKNGMIVKIIISKMRISEIGDKFCSFTAQKGVCGMMYNQEDMPFSASGMCPDIIINPHCIPSRMTINQLMACILGKVKSLTSKTLEIDGTPFFGEKNSFRYLCSLLQEEGFSYNGTETLYNGFTGEKIQTDIFIGPVYYHRLKHLVSDKIHARANGQVTALTRQPNCGRSRNGGLRVGEMEKDSMLVHGVSRFIKERMFEMSDYFETLLCKSCGVFAAEEMCFMCKQSDHLVTISIPYASKLLFQELLGMGIKIKIEV
jgi:DNA-directed RNA polymerase II subunit RPB2